MKKFLLLLFSALPLIGQTMVQKGTGNVLSNGAIVVGNGNSITATGTGVIAATSTPGITINTTAPLTGGGALSGNLTLAMPAASTSTDGYLTSTDWNLFNNATGLTFTSPLSRSGNAVSIPAATGSVNGYLTSANWTAFNSKQAAGNYITALTGDGTAAGPGSSALTLATVNSNVGTFAGITINGKGLVTAASALTTLAGYGITDGVNAVTNDTNVTGSVSGHTLTLGWTGALAVSRGGSGAATLTGVLLGNGTSAFSAATLSNLTLSGSTLSISSSYAGQSSIVTVGTLTSGAIGSGFTAIPNSALANASITVGTTPIALGASSTTLAGLTTITGPTGNLTIVAGSGNSRTLTMQTTTSGGTATNALVLNADQSASLPAGLLNGSATALALAAGSATGGTVVPVAQTITTLVYEGDSLTAPISEGRSNYYLTTNAFFSSATGYNVATGGDTAQNMVTEYESQGRIYRPANAGGGGVFFIWAGINDILNNGRTASQVYNDLKTIWAKARADGYRVVAFTLTPSTGYSGATETTRLAVNTSIRADATLYDFLIQPDVLFPDATNTANYPDGTHISTAASVTLGNNIDGIVTQPTTNSSAFAAGVVHAAGSTYNSLLQVSGNLGLNEDGNGASAVIRYGSTYSTTGALYFDNGPTHVFTLSRSVNTSSSPLTITSSTNAFDAAGTSGAVSTLGGLSVAKDIWSGGLNVTGPSGGTGAFVTFGTGTGTSHAVLTLNRSGTGVNAAIKGQTAGVAKWSWGMNNDGTTNWAVYNDVLGSNALTISQTDSSVTLAAGITATGATINFTGSGGTIINRVSGTTSLYTSWQQAGSDKVYTGISGTGQFITGAASGDYCIRANGQSIYLSTDNGTTASLKIAASTHAATFAGTLTSDATTIATTSATAQVLQRTSGTSNLTTQYQYASTIKAIVGLAGTTDGIIVGSVAGDFAVRAQTQSILFSTDGGASAAVKLAATTNVATFAATTEATTGGTGAATFAGGIYATKVIVSGSATDATSITTGGIIGAGGLGITKAAWIGGLANIAGVLTAANTTEASNSTTAGTVVSGGLAVAKKIITASSITTGAPTAGSAAAWKLGDVVTSVALTVSTTNGLRVNIGGTDYTLAVLTTNP